MDKEEREQRLSGGISYGELPGLHITINQLVAYNLAYWRKAAGLTQEELGQQIGWSKAAVSAAERSWDGKRLRQFDADLLMQLSFILHVPLSAFFLPPEDDGVDKRYLFDHVIDSGPTGQEMTCRDMHDVMCNVLSDPVDEDTPVMVRHRNRLVTTANFYFGAGRDPNVQFLEDLTTEEQIVNSIARTREQYEVLRGVMSDVDKLHDSLTNRLIELNGSRRKVPDAEPKKESSDLPPS